MNFQKYFPELYYVCIVPLERFRGNGLSFYRKKKKNFLDFPERTLYRVGKILVVTRKVSDMVTGKMSTSFFGGDHWVILIKCRVRGNRTRNLLIGSLRPSHFHHSSLFGRLKVRVTNVFRIMNFL